jgi:hypothetical protein
MRAAPHDLEGPVSIRSPRLAAILVILGTTLLFLSSVVLVTARGILDPDQFSRRIAASLGDERVASYVAGQVTHGIIAQRPNLIAVQAILEASVRAVVGSAAFRAVVRTSARAAHRSLFETKGERVVLALPDVSALVRGALSQASPELAAKIPPGIESALASESAQRAFSSFIAVWQLGERILIAGWVVFYLALVLVVVGLWAAPDRRRGLVFAGTAFAATGIALLIVPALVRLGLYASLSEPRLRGAAIGVWQAYIANLRWLALINVGVGLVLASAGTSALEAVDPLARGQRLWSRITASDASRAHRFARGVALLALGGWAIAAPSHVLVTVGVLAGIGLAYIGLRDLFRGVLASAPGQAQQEAASGGRYLWMLVTVAVLVAAIPLAGVAYLMVRSDDRAVAAAGAVTTCNGSVVLCDYAINDVVFPGAHNAMSNASVPGWMFPHHSYGIRRMLDDGIRMLAIDIHYGVPTAGRVRTDFEREDASVQKIEGALGAEATAAAVRIRDQLVGDAEGPSAMYFCHGFCELGAYPIEPTLREIREFLLLNPGEVVVLVIEDYVLPADLHTVFDETGLLDFVYTGRVSDPWPSLREVIEANQRLIVFSEVRTAGVGWLHPAFATIQETPYTFHTTTDFSCRPNRGGTSGSLFQMNHWIETTPAPRPSIADSVNAYDFLLRRARRCERERDRIPNIIAVDFYDHGDVLRVARTLNGVDSAATAAGR